MNTYEVSVYSREDRAGKVSRVERIQEGKDPMDAGKRAFPELLLIPTKYLVKVEVGACVFCGYWKGAKRKSARRQDECRSMKAYGLRLSGYIQREETVYGKNPMDACKRAYPELELIGMSRVRGGAQVCIKLVKGQHRPLNKYIGFYMNKT